VVPVRLPPLRDRQGDVPLLVRFYVDTFNREFRKAIQGLSPEAMAALEAHAWPGNVRELRNLVERAMLLADGPLLGAGDFEMLRVRREGGSFELPPGGIDFDRLERDLVAQALQRAGGNQTRAAALLGMNRDQIRYRIDKFGLSRRPAWTRLGFLEA